MKLCSLGSNSAELLRYCVAYHSHLSLYIRPLVCADDLQITGDVHFPSQVRYSTGDCSIGQVKQLQA